MVIMHALMAILSVFAALKYMPEGNIIPVILLFSVAVLNVGALIARLIIKQRRNNG